MIPIKIETLLEGRIVEQNRIENLLAHSPSIAKGLGGVSQLE